MKNAGVTQFGAGWAGLVHDGGIAVVSTPNLDSPIADNKTPLFGVDVWEHAYYRSTRTSARTTSTPGEMS
jgi:superoxide dismutase, Fe-Mn family